MVYTLPQIYGERIEPESLPLSQNYALFISNSLRIGNFSRNNIPDYNNVKDALECLDLLRAEGTRYVVTNVTAHNIAARKIAHLFSDLYSQKVFKDTDPRVDFITAYGSYARHDPVEEEDIDLNVFVHKKPSNNKDLRKLDGLVVQLYKETLKEVNPNTRQSMHKMHGPNIYDRTDVIGFINYSSIFYAFAVCFALGDNEPITEIIKEIPQKKTKMKLQKMLVGESVNLGMYPSLTSPDVAFQTIAYPEKLFDANPRLSSTFTNALQDLLILDPIYRRRMLEWMSFEIDRVSSRLKNAVDINCRPDVPQGEDKSFIDEIVNFFSKLNHLF